MKNLLISSAVVGLAVIAAAPAAATDYLGTHALAAGSVTFSMTTDDTIGVLSMANVLSWSITLTGANGPVTMDQSNADWTYLSGASFQATSTELLFDFDNGGGHMQFDDFGRGGGNALCMDSTNPVQNTCVGQAPSEVFLALGDEQFTPRSGILVLGTAVSSPAPEPASWAMMLGGFGMIGGAMRSRRKALVSFG